MSDIYNMKFKITKNEQWWGEGYEFEDGSCVVRWYGNIVSLVFYQNFDDVTKLHCEDITPN